MITWTVTHSGPVTTQRNVFHELWAELHSKIEPDQVWFDGWLNRVPCGECRDSFRKYVADNPPDFANFRQWAIDAHNWVNAKLGKPIWTS